MAATRRPARSLKDVDLLTEDRRRRQRRQIWVVSLGRFTQVQSVELSSECLTWKLRNVYFLILVAIRDFQHPNIHGVMSLTKRLNTSKHPNRMKVTSLTKRLNTSKKSKKGVLEVDFAQIPLPKSNMTMENPARMSCTVSPIETWDQFAACHVSAMICKEKNFRAHHKS